ncbi:MAG: glycosyltransferase family 4 protein [Candidatus Helarchaeota archaeon]
MRVLWFANTLCNADEYFNKELKGTGGWLKELDKVMQDKVDLHVAFYVDYPKADFIYKNTKYHPINRFNSKIEKTMIRVLRRIPSEGELKQYLKIIERVKPDIIHIHGTELPFISIIDVVNKPIVTSVQGNLTVYVHKYFSGIEKKFASIKADGNVFKKVFYPMTFYKSYSHLKTKSYLERKYLKKIKYIIGRTNWDKRITRILSPSSYYYHADEILREGFYKNIWSKPQNDKFTIFTTSGNVYYKGFETICQSLNMLNNLGQHIIWKVAGIKNNDLIVKVVKKKLKENYPERNLELLGNLNEDQLIQGLLNSDLYVMPSHIENSPNNLCEAMILGMPCIATFVGGTGSLLNDGKEGILIQDGDPWVLAGAILEAKENYHKFIRFGQNARKKAIYRHNRDKIAREILKIYFDVINKNGFKNY